MRHFRIYILLYLLAVAGTAGMAVWCFISQRPAWGVACVIASLLAACAIAAAIGKLTGAMSSFAHALEMDDTSFKMPVDRLDPNLKMMGESMNRIMDSHRADKLAMETRKLYYDRILRVMTHEMRNSITPVISLSEDMMSHPEHYDSQSREEAIGVIHAQSEGIKRFLDSYHTLTHLPAPALQRVDASLFFNEIKTAFESRCAHDSLPEGMISYTVPVGLTLSIDPGLIRQAVSNLIGNAIDAVASSSRPQIRVTVSQTDGHPVISIEDNGAGISRAILPDIFQPFITDKPGGSGIGLCLSRQIAMLHGGDLKVASTGAHGTTFVISLPLPDED